MRLGEFGAAQRELGGESDEFGFFGETFTVPGAIPAVLMLQLGAAATGKIEEAEGFAAMWEALRCSLTKPAHDDEAADDSQFTRLYKLAVEKQCDLDPLMTLVFALFEAQGGRPTRQAPDSSPGPTTISPSSSALSTQAEQSHLRSVASLVRGEGLTASGSDSALVLMGDGQLAHVEYGPERTG